jgi:hypothetical protein
MAGAHFVMRQEGARDRHLDVTLIRVAKRFEHVDVLHELLLGRSHAISHKSMPNFRQHKAFVFSHPYRVWYLIKAEEGFVGSIYLMKNNTIGVSTAKGAERYMKPAIERLVRKHKPLPAVRSVRGPDFDFNVLPSNKKLISILQSMGAHLAQITYELKAAECRNKTPPRGRARPGK